MAHSITIEALAAGLNQSVRRYGSQLNALMRQGLEFEQELPFVQADYIYTGQDAAIGQVIQPYQHQFTPVNAETFDGIDNTLRPIKIDLQFTAEQLEKFFSRWMPNWFTPDPEDTRVNYAQLILERLVLPKAMEELNLASWKGEYSAPTPGTAGAILESVDGFKTNIADQISAGRLTPITTGVIDSANMLDQVRQFCNDVPEPYRYKRGKIFMSKTNAQYYSDSYKGAYLGNSAVITGENITGLRLRVDDYNKEIVGVTAMEGDDRFIMVFENEMSMIVGTRTGYPQYFQFRFEPEDRNLKVFAEIYRFYGFETCLHMFVNDQA